jgi:hypothetical protein
MITVVIQQPRVRCKQTIMFFPNYSGNAMRQSKKSAKEEKKCSALIKVGIPAYVKTTLHLQTPKLILESYSVSLLKLYVQVETNTNIMTNQNPRGTACDSNP